MTDYERGKPSKRPETSAQDIQSTDWMALARGVALGGSGDARYKDGSPVGRSDASLTEKEVAALLNVDRPVSRQQLRDAGIDPDDVAFDPESR